MVMWHVILNFNFHIELKVYAMTLYKEICDTQTEKLLIEDNPLSFVIALSVINTFLSLTASVGNLLILLGLKRCRTIHAPSKALLFSLAMTDLGVGLFSQPLFAAFKIIGYRQDYYKPVCIMAIFDTLFGDALAAVSLLLVSVISIDRYMAYRLRGKYRSLVTLKKTILAVICCWLIACAWVGLGVWEKNSARVFQTVVVSLCLIVPIASYVNIYVGLRFCSSHIRVRSVLNAIHMPHYKKSAITMAYVCGFLLLCYLPHFVLEAISGFFNDEQTYLRVKNCTKTIAYFSSSINPLIYCWRIQEIFDFASSSLSRLFCIRSR